jgi:hypothetical protein
MQSLPPFSDRLGQVPEDLDVGVGQQEESLPEVGRADLIRAEDARFNSEAHFLKVSADGFKPEADVPLDVFDTEKRRTAFVEDAPHMRPEVTGIVDALAASRCTERLTRVPPWSNLSMGCCRDLNARITHLCRDFRKVCLGRKHF